jgi:two-component system sensor histidine kinase YesM
MKIFSKQPYSLRSKLLAYFLFLVLSMIVLMDTFFIYKMTEVVRQDTHIYSYEIVKQLGRNIDSYITYMQEIIWMISRQDVGIKEQLKGEVEGSKIRGNKFLEQLKNRANIATGVVTTLIVGENGIVLTDNPYSVKDYLDLRELNWYKEAVLAKGEPVISSSHTQNYLQNDSKWVFSVSQAVLDDTTGEILGVILVDMNYRKLTDMCNDLQLGDKGYVYIINEKGEIIYHPKQQLIFSGILKEDIERVMNQKEGSYLEKGKDNRFVTVHTLEDIGWSVIGVAYFGELLAGKEELYLSVVCLTGLCIVFAFFASRKMARKIADPIAKLKSLITEVEKGSFDITVSVNTDMKEIQHLAHSFDRMVKEIKGLIKKVEINQKKLRQTELNVLQAQINPHFLYNALDTIIWLGEAEEHEKVVQMTGALAKYFRLSLSKGKEVISIGEEIEHVKYYLSIQKIRYPQKLNYCIEVEPKICEYLTVKIILQPLVENALYHGIKDKVEGGLITIRGKCIEDEIVLEVIDDGKGMTEEEVKGILIKPISRDITTGGVAIKNVHQRLQIYFGENYGLRYHSELGKGTTVSVHIPIIKENLHE